MRVERIDNGRRRFAALVPVFMLIVIGFLLRRCLIAEDAHWVGLERLLYYVMFPALLIGTHGARRSEQGAGARGRRHDAWLAC